MPYGVDNSKMFEAYKAKFKPASQMIIEKLDLVGQEDADINNDGKIDSSDEYIKNRRKKIADKITQHKKQQSEDAEQHAKSKHSDALYIWDYLLHKKNYSPQEAMEVVHMAKAAFEHLI